MDIEDVISRLAGATDEELSDALTHLAGQAAEAGEQPVTEDSVAALESLATATTQVLAEQGRRIELAERVSKARAAFANIPTAPVEEAPTEEAAAKPAEEDDERLAPLLEQFRAEALWLVGQTDHHPPKP